MSRILPKNSHLIPEQAKLVFRGIIYDVYHWEQELYDGSTVTFERLKRPDTVVIISVDENKVFYVEEEQPPDVKRLNFPSGRVDKNETWETAAKREAVEELGANFNNWRLINVTQPIEKIEWFVAYYLAWDKNEINYPNNDSGEKIKIRSGSYNDVIKTINQNPKSYQPSFLDKINSIEELMEIPSFIG